jgi:hypothetical protein
VLDTVDLHGLRSARERLGGQGEACLPEIADLGADGLRELASILRSDLALVISPVELDLLKSWGVPGEELELCRVLYPELNAALPRERGGFSWIGNFRHPPNLDSLFWLHREIWPRIRGRLLKAEAKAEAQISIYGAYPSREVMALNDLSSGFLCQGPTPDATRALAGHLVNLAPLRSGAGIKGKIVDGWRAETPAVATPVAAEGLCPELEPWGGLIATGAQDFADAAVKLATDPPLARKLGHVGRVIAHELFDPVRESARLLERIESARARLQARRSRQLLGRILRHETLRSTEYFSRWIELKESARAESPGKFPGSASKSDRGFPDSLPTKYN